MFIFIIDQELLTRELMSRIIGYEHSLDRNDILKFVYFLLSYFLQYMLLNNFLLLVPYSDKEG
jgi:hypothetical protein